MRLPFFRSRIGKLLEEPQVEPHDAKVDGVLQTDDGLMVVVRGDDEVDYIDIHIGDPSHRSPAGVRIGDRIRLHYKAGKGYTNTFYCTSKPRPDQNFGFILSFPTEDGCKTTGLYNQRPRYEKL